MGHSTEITWKEDMHFESDLLGHTIKIDADEKFGGKNRGPIPKPLLLVALGGCTGMDVISILNKMRVDYKDFSVKVSGETTDEHPIVYKSIHIIYEIKGDNLPYSKIKKAVDLSQEQYCGVSAMLKKACEITYEIKGEGLNTAN